jgi:glycosyltransferase involved in cell wall biosynthesis
MNLLMITGDRALAQGRQSAFYNTLQALHTHWNRIDVVCPNAGVRRYQMQIFGNVFIHPSPWPAIFQWFWIRFQGARIIRQHHANVMTVHESPFMFNGIGASWLSRATRVPYMLEVHHVVGYPRAAGFGERLGRALSRIMIPRDARTAAVVRTVNEHQAPDWLVGAGVPRGKIKTIPSIYLDQTVFRPDDAIEKKYDVAFVGRLVNNKGLPLFLDIVERTGLVAVVIGDGPLARWARWQAKKRHLKLHVTGFLHDATAVATTLRHSRLVLMTSLNEGGPRVVVEALACGVPVVATPVGIVPDILPPECVEDWNASDMATKVNNLLSDPQLYARVREAGLFTAQRFEKTQAIALYAEELKKIALP